MIEASNLVKCFLFADDTAVLHQDKDITKLSDNLNMEIDKISNWLTANKLSLNIAMSKLLLFGLTNKTESNKFEIHIKVKNYALLNLLNTLAY